jgi:hypothetical protein
LLLKVNSFGGSLLAQIMDNCNKRSFQQILLLSLQLAPPPPHCIPINVVDPDPWFLMAKSRKNDSRKNVPVSCFDQKLQFTYPLKTSKLQDKLLALKREHPSLRKMKFTNFFLFLWAIFGPPGSGSNPDLDPGSQHC